MSDYDSFFRQQMGKYGVQREERTPRIGGVDYPSFTLAAPVQREEEPLVSAPYQVAPETESLVSRGLRGVGALLSPLQLPQDILFSITEGLYSDEENVWDNLREMEWGRYTPWTEAPKRVATGRDILAAAGVDDEETLQWGGIIMDLAVDPLLFGSYLRGASKAVGGSESLLRAADRVDNLSQSVMLAGGVPTARSMRQVARVTGRPGVTGVERTAGGVATGRGAPRFEWVSETETAELLQRRVNNAYNRITTQPVRDSIQARMDRLAEFTTRLSFNLQYAPIKLPGGRELTLPGGRKPSVASLFMVDGGTDPALRTAIQQRYFEAREPAEDAVWEIANLLRQQGDPRAQQLLDRLNRSQTVHVRDIPKRLAEAPVKTSTLSAIQSSAYGVVDQASPIVTISRETREGMGEVGEFISSAEKAISRQPMFRQETVPPLGSFTPPRVQGPTPPRVQGPTPPRVQGPTSPRVQGPTPPRVQGPTPPRVQGPTPPRVQGPTPPFVPNPRVKDVRLTPSEVMEEVFGAQRNLLDEEMKRIRQVAIDNGDDPDIAANLLRATVNDVAKADAMLGYYSTLLPWMKDEAIAQPIRWLENLKATDPRFANLDAVWSPQAQQDWAAKIWRAGETAGVTGKLDEFYKKGFTIPRSVARQLKIKEDERLKLLYRGRQSFEKLENIEGGLKPADYFRSFREGHLRRSFGVFNNRESHEQMMRHIESGRIVVKNIVDEVVLSPESNLGISRPELTAAVQRILDQRSPISRDGRVFGVSVSQKEVKQQLLDDGFDVDEINDWFMQFIREADESEVIARNLENVQRFLNERYGARIGGETAGRVGGAGAAAFRARNRELDEMFLASLLESMDPGVSIIETAAAAERSIGQRLAINEIIQYVSRNPELSYTSKNAAPKGFVWISGKQTGQYGDLAGKYVHPMVYRELNNVMAGAKDPGLFGRSAAMLRSMVTGGYLANPATTVTNVLGGFFTAFLYGQNPISLATEMVDVWNDFRRTGGDMDDFRRVGPLLGDTLTQADIVRLAPDLKSRQLMDERDAVEMMSDFARNLYSGYQEYVIRKPLGISALGLQPFEISENLFRVAAYRQGIKRGLSDEEAFNFARFMVFDYGAQPEVVRLMRDSGLVLFPSFPYFMMGRTLNAAWNRPGVLAASDRVSEAVWNAAVPNEQEQMALWGGMNDWMRRDQYVPLWPITNDKDERVGWQFLPLGQMLMTNGFSGLTGDFVTEQLEQGGLWGPLYDVVSSITQWDESDGTARFGQQFGRQVWSPSANNQEKLQGLASFIYESFAPGFARKLVLPGSPTEPAGGLIPSLSRQIFTLPGDAGANAQAMTDVYSRQPDRGIAAELFTTFVRSTRPVTWGGQQGQDMIQPLRSAMFEYERQLRDLNERRQVAASRGNQGEVQRLTERIQELREQFIQEYGPYRDLSTLGAQMFGGSR